MTSVPPDDEARAPEIDHDPVGCIVDELKRANASGAVVAQDGDLNDLVNNMLAEGYTLSETVYVHGKRIRYLVPPERPLVTTTQRRDPSQELFPLVDDDEDPEED